MNSCERRGLYILLTRGLVTTISIPFAPMAAGADMYRWGRWAWGCHRPSELRRLPRLMWLHVLCLPRMLLLLLLVELMWGAPLL